MPPHERNDHDLLIELNTKVDIILSRDAIYNERFATKDQVKNIAAQIDKDSENHAIFATKDQLTPVRSLCYTMAAMYLPTVAFIVKLYIDFEHK